MSKISIDTHPLKDNSTAVFGPYKLKGFHPEFTRIIIRSDLSCTVTYSYHQYSEDPRDTHLQIQQKIAGHGKYRSDKFQIISRYVTLEIKKDPNTVAFSQQGESFLLEIFSVLPKEKKDPDGVPPPELPSRERGSGGAPSLCQESFEVTERHKSPFKGLFQRKSVAKRSSFSTQGEQGLSQEPTPKPKYTKLTTDWRIPEFLPTNSLLSVNRHHQVYCIAPPETSGMILYSDSNQGYEWKKFGNISE